MAVFPAFFGLLLAGVVTAQVEITPREAVRRVGEDLEVVCKVPYHIDSCRMQLGSTSYLLRPQVSEGEVVYAGRGLEFGECGAHIKGVKEAWNGNVTCVLPPRSGSIEITATMALIVARAPEPPQLTLWPQQASFRAGERVDAQCLVRDGRPEAVITWWLDEEPLLSGVHQRELSTDPATGLTTVAQNVTRVLTYDDAGRRLVCRATHQAHPAPRDVGRQLVVNFPPVRAEGEGPITMFGLQLGLEGRLNVTVRAAPAPRAEWTVAGQRLVAPQQNDDATITALEPVALGNNYYNVTLVLRRVTKEDVERSYYLRVTNDLGREEYSLTISTMPEPIGVELDAGAIVGIVVGVLALLVAVFLVVFARATQRWCFAGRNREQKSSGESDTESATVTRERSRLAALGARVRAALPKARDKVTTSSSTDAPQHEDKPTLAEDKKGVVYAELALGEGEQRGPAPAPPPADYAEIVYTEGEKTAKE